ncbi:MAG TPA: lantibiotic dehydratase [Longimicrobiaceae bacterium]
MASSPRHPFRPSGFFVLRTPLLPFDELLEWAEGLTAVGAAGGPARLEAAVAEDRARLRERLRRAVARPEVREAVFVASPDLEESLETWLREPESERGERVELALVRYFERMAGRATPFGLFAGCAVGEVGERTELATPARAERRRHTRLDMDYLSSLVDALCADPELRGSLRHFPNSSIYRAAGRLRYVESRLERGVRTHHLVAVDHTPYLDVALERARGGARPSEVVDALLEYDAEIDREDAAGYVEELVASQLLVPELEPPVTGGEALDAVLAELRRHPAAADAAERLEQAREALRRLDAAPPSEDAPRRYREVAELLSGLPAKVEMPRLFQVDMTRPAGGAVLGGAVVAEVSRGVELLHRVGAAGGDERLAAFRTAFQARYEGREVPLVEALDEEIGIGFEASGAPGAEGSPLLQGLEFAGDGKRTVPWGKREARLLRILEDARARGAVEVELRPEDVAELAPDGDPAPLPDAFSVRAMVAAASPEALEAGDFRVELEGAGGPSGARILGRFCHADPELRRLTEEHLRAEEAFRPDATFAEVVHLPEGRIGNILFRPVLRGYEIPYLGRSGAPADRLIPVTDLLVSVSGDRITLRSARLGRTVVPRLTSAHNFSRRSVGVYRFLCSLQTQGVAGGAGWSWGTLERSAFLPRVVSGKLVLSRARWRLEEADLKRLREPRAPARFARVQEMRAARGLPRWVTLADGDNELPVDLDNVLSVEAFLHAVRSRSDAVLREMFPPPEELAARGPEGRFVHELVIPFERHPAPRPERRAAPARAAVPRRFPPGSEWLYAKLYTGTSTADHLLREVVRPLVRGAMASGAADRWFFIRYGDPDWHLRLRLHGAPERLLGEVLPALNALVEPLLEDGSVWRVQLDTYDREVERYGGPEGIDLSERLFHADSEATLALLDPLSGDEGAELRWKVALCGTDALLGDLGLDAASRREVARGMEAAMAKEFGKQATLKRELSDRFRRDRAALEELLGALRGGGDLPPELAPLRSRSEALRPVVAALREREEAGRLTFPVAGLASSYAHMHLNRLLRSSARAQEMVIYHLLGRLYEAEAARARSG